jgi:hypothetical protein
LKRMVAIIQMMTLRGLHFSLRKRVVVQHSHGLLDWRCQCDRGQYVRHGNGAAAVKNYKKFMR